jgi:hypothetical protein
VQRADGHEDDENDEGTENDEGESDEDYENGEGTETMKAKVMKVSRALPAPRAKVVCKICKGEHDTDFYDLAKLRALRDAACENDAVCLLCDPGKLFGIVRQKLYMYVL